MRTLETRGSELEALLDRCAAGDSAALRELYDRQAPRLHGIALSITRRRDLAADAVHDGFIRIWQNAARFEPERGSAEAWLISIVRYRALDIARRQQREITGVEVAEPADPDPDALTRLIGSAEADALRRCIDALDQDKRRLVVLAFTHGLTHSALARQLGMPMGTVKSLIRRGLIGLRHCLAEAGVAR